MPAPGYGYIPAKLSVYSTWMDNFSNTLNATPAAYMVSALDAASVAAANTTFQSAYALSTNPATRTSVTVAATSAARFNLTSLVRSWASQIRLNPGVSDADKTALGLRLPNASPAPIPKPATWPVLGLQGYGPLIHNLKFADSSTPALKAKPYGAIGMQLFRTVADAADTDFANADYVGTFTKNYPIIEYLSADGGKIATYWARWTTRGASDGSTEANVGPLSPHISAGISS